jgi:hypothetical protein
MESLYQQYFDYVKQCNVYKSYELFKMHPSYTYMLEHVSKEQGDQYLDCIKKFTNINDEEIKEFCIKNDQIGTPIKSDFGFVTTSPTNLRYIFQAYLILSHFKSKCINEPIDILELGGGYGGLCLAIHHFASKYDIKINSYTIVDLSEILKLQRYYLDNHNISVNFVDAFTYGKEIENKEYYLVSCYCFSEISKDHQQNYITHLFPKIRYGFITWNEIEVYAIGFTTSIEEEYPKTGPKNKYVKF